MNYQSAWEDEENNRTVDLRVDYEFVQDSLEIKAIRPTRVSFQCPHSGDQLRSVGVYGDRAARHLNRKFRESGQLEKLEIEIIEQAPVVS